MAGLNWRAFRLGPWGRRNLIALVVVLASGLYFSVLAEGFRVSTAAILYPVLLVALMRDSHLPDAGPVTGLWVVASRACAGLLRGGTLGAALLREYPGGVFYLCYDALLCLLVRDRRSAGLPRLGGAFFLCDLLSNTVNLFLSSRLALLRPVELLSLAGVALLRSAAAAGLLLGTRHYRQFLLREEHESRYRRLFLMTADLKTELYFLKKDAEDIESVMTHAYRLYEGLEGRPGQEEHAALALSIARDVHEVKKDNLRIIRGLEEAAVRADDGEALSLSDLLGMLEVTTRQMLGDARSDIRLECRLLSEDLPVREHYRLLSVLKNLVTNAVEAIEAGNGKGLVRVECRTEGENLVLTVADDGPGISKRAQEVLFQVGYSTKFDPSTGNINRGVGLSAVQFIVEELGGTIRLESEPGKGAKFEVSLSLAAVMGGKA